MFSHSNNSNVLLLACEPIPLVRIAFIGLGKRGKESFNHYMYIDGVEIKVVADLSQENISEVQHILEKNGKSKADQYQGRNDWREICKRTDIDLVYVCTGRSLHAEIAIYAMQHGKHVAVEVPAANNLKECWAIVNTAETYRRHCFMLENCCYGNFELSTLNMKRQGLLGKITHAEGSYIHDLRNIDFSERPGYADLWLMEGNPYPTHGLGPLCQALDIHRGDRLAWLVSVSNKQFGYPNTGGSDYRESCVLGNMNTTIIKTEKQKTIVLQHDITSPRPYERKFLLSGTNAFVKGGDNPVINLYADNGECDLSSTELLEKYKHPFYNANGDLASRVGSHGGMDFIMDYRLIYCLQNGFPLDIDVYDAAEWSSLIELTAMSVKNNSMPVEIPDFTRGAWKMLDGLSFAE